MSSTASAPGRFSDLTAIRRTPIVATIGPASRPVAILEALMRAGVRVCRLNCSHSGPDQIREDIRMVRRVARNVDHPVAILLDLQGPKIRTGPATEPLVLQAGDTLVLVMDPEYQARPGRMGTTWPALADDLQPGERVLFNDGELAAVVTAVQRGPGPAEVVLCMETGGLLGAHKGINLPGVPLSAPCLTPKDLEDLAAGVDEGVDYVALSFVRSSRDLDILHGHLERLGHAGQPVCAKIEKPQALDDLDGILDRVDAIMVARGDLGVEIELAQVPLVQKRLIHEANRRGVLVITATQMLESMCVHPRPTRAEVTDVCNAILDGTDAVMLSGETAAGQYPVAAVEMMDRIARTTEQSGFLVPPPLSSLPDVPGVGDTIARAACFAVRELPRPLVVFTWSGTTAIIASKSRPPGHLFALTPNKDAFHRLALAWGVTPVLIPLVDGVEQLIRVGEEALLRLGLVEVGQEVVMLTGKTPTRGATNTVTLQVIRGVEPDKATPGGNAAR